MNVSRAIQEAELAYRFSPNSYTASALVAVLDLAKGEKPDWVMAFLDWNDDRALQDGH